MNAGPTFADPSAEGGELLFELEMEPPQAGPKPGGWEHSNLHRLLEPTILIPTKLPAAGAGAAAVAMPGAPLTGSDGLMGPGPPVDNLLLDGDGVAGATQSKLDLSLSDFDTVHAAAKDPFEAAALDSLDVASDLMSVLTVGSWEPKPPPMEMAKPDG